ncbi:hypothetical protein GCM10022409_16880 [Hymenobacter glaciei]|uniref:DUF4235 domain-containing protein n=1 Tax=Hymenobacter glaciei TaxID=877209 RepID=A0ABP7TZ64_9BACT
MLKPLLILTFGVFSFAAQAQTTEATPPVTPATTGASAPALATKGLRQGQGDTIAAIGRLYTKRRLGGKVWAGVTAGGGLALLRALGAGSSNSSGSSTSGYNIQPKAQVDGGTIAVVAGIFVALPLIVGISKLSTYSETNEKAIVDAYRDGKPLPKNLINRLSPDYFY